MLAEDRAEETETRKRHRRVRASDTDSPTNASIDAADDQYEYYDSITTTGVPGTTTTSLIAEKEAMPRMVKIKEPEVTIDVVILCRPLCRRP